MPERWGRSLGERTRLFAPGRMVWTVHRETALLLGAGRALLLQLAHPLVAAAITEHSAFAQDPLGRLSRTLDTMYTIVFDDIDAALAAVRRMNTVHQRVRGRLREPAGPFAMGTPYHASDPSLRLWVHATLIDTGLLVYDRFVAPFSAAEQAHYYADARELAHILEIPFTPATIEEFRAYVARMLESETITVSATARTAARMILHPLGAPRLRVVGALLKFVTVGLLPPEVREQYGYPWSPVREQVLDVFAAAVRRALPTTPSVIRIVPQARATERQLRLAASARPAA